MTIAVQITLLYANWSLDRRPNPMQVVVLDDKSPRINYTTGWYSPEGQSVDYNQTVTVSGGPNAGFHFALNGTSISVYGRIPPNNTAVSTYTIDVASPVTFVNPNSTQDSSRQMFYQSPVLQDGPHILAVNAPDTAVGDPASQFFFDFLTYAPSPLSPTQSTSSSAKSRGVKTILPAVLVPCLVCVILLVLGLFVQRRRKLAALQRKPTPYKIEDGLLLLPSAPGATASTFSDMYGTPDNSNRRPESPLSSVVCGTGTSYTLSEPPSMAVAVPSLSSLRAQLPPTAFVPDPMLATTRVRRLQRFDGASILAASAYTEEFPPTYRSS